jgi:hypothetical protein
MRTLVGREGIVGSGEVGGRIERSCDDIGRTGCAVEGCDSNRRHGGGSGIYFEIIQEEKGVLAHIELFRTKHESYSCDVRLRWRVKET